MGSNGTLATHGNVVLTHEIDNATMSLAISNLPNIMKNYKHVVDVATCNNITNPYQEDTVTLPTFAQFVGGQSATTSGNGTSSNGSSSGSASTAHQSGSTSAGMNIVPTAGFAIATIATLFATLF